MRSKIITFIFSIFIFAIALSGNIFANNTDSLDLERSSSQYAIISNASQTGLNITDDITIEAWIKLEQLPSDAGSTMVIASKNESGDYGYIFGINSANKLYLLYYSDDPGNTYKRAAADTAFNSGDLGTWIHVAAKADVSVSAINLYKNGSVASDTEDGSGSATTINNTTADFIVGADYEGSYSHFDGLIDEVRVWNDLRTSDEILDNYLKELVGNEANLQGYWKLNSDFMDETSNSNDLTGANSPVFSTDNPVFPNPNGPSNTDSLDLERSSSQYAVISNTSQTGLNITDDITIEAWIKLEQLPADAGGAMMIVSKSESGDYGYEFGVSSANKLYLLYYTDDPGNTYKRGTADTAFSSGDVGTWIHVAAKADVSAGVINLYKNGSVASDTEDGSGSATAINNTAADFVVGANYEGSSSYFDGLIDEVRVWNDLRTSNEILDNYQKELVGSEENLQGYWKLNSDYSDETSNSNDLSGANSPVFSTDNPVFPNPNNPSNTESLDLERSSSQYAVISNASQTGLNITDDITIEAWIKLEQLPADAGGAMMIVSKSESGDYGYEFGVSSANKLYLLYYTDDPGNTYKRGTADTAFSSGDVGTWVHVAVKADVSEGAISMFKNGTTVSDTEDGSGSATAINNTAADFVVGANYEGSSSYFDGIVDEVRVWNDLRTSDELLDNYQKELIGSEGNLQGYWALNSDYSDETSNNNDLSGANSPVFSTDDPLN